MIDKFIMFTLVAWNPKTKRERTNQGLRELYLFEDEAIDFAEFWLVVHPGDIVMFVEVQTDICKYCDTPIQEKPGWVFHRWIHIRSLMYTCAVPGLPKAEPKERE